MSLRRCLGLCRESFGHEDTSRTGTIVCPSKADEMQAVQRLFFQALYERFQSDISHMAGIVGAQFATPAPFGAVFE
jgi:hypothetical protein